MARFLRSPGHQGDVASRTVRVLGSSSSGAGGDTGWTSTRVEKNVAPPPMSANLGDAGPPPYTRIALIVAAENGSAPPIETWGCAGRGLEEPDPRRRLAESVLPETQPVFNVNAVSMAATAS